MVNRWTSECAFLYDTLTSHTLSNACQGEFWGFGILFEDTLTCETDLTINLLCLMTENLMNQKLSALITEQH